MLQQCNPMHKIFGKYLLEERRKKKRTTVMLAKACGISRSYITLIENGKRLPGKKIIPKIATVLNTKTEVVFNWYMEDIAQKIRKDLKI